MVFLCIYMQFLAGFSLSLYELRRACFCDTMLFESLYRTDTKFVSWIWPVLIIVLTTVRFRDPFSAICLSVHLSVTLKCVDLLEQMTYLFLVTLLFIRIVRRAFYACKKDLCLLQDWTDAVETKQLFVWSCTADSFPFDSLPQQILSESIYLPSCKRNSNLSTHLPLFF